MKDFQLQEVVFTLFFFFFGLLLLLFPGPGWFSAWALEEQIFGLYIYIGPEDLRAFVTRFKYRLGLI